ncbi:hypothetical protein SS50377_27559 [Spironucleus salmonicida]|uniref:Transmembrane domain-containing protein n=1 Tax=Spironucleus salmonicida TaxID=348837 RepID=V6LR11_9EUKA|nr:hypothetical protein SS50377_27559 [Spironucleus salmonicida]|eukprot:EST46663.1 Transmembrane domain-containing protein [Spironucleus salmonicida]
MERNIKIVKFTALLPDTQFLQHYKTSYVIINDIQNFTRSQLSTKLNISLRDVRTLLVVSQQIEPRENAIIISFGEINAIIKQNSFFLIYQDASELFYQKFSSIFNQILELERNTEIEHHFELLALETALHFVISNLSLQFNQIENQSNQFFKVAETLVGQQNLAQCQQSLAQVESEAQTAQSTLQKLLENESDLANLAFQNQYQDDSQSENSSILEHLVVDIEIISDIIENYLFQVRNLKLEVQELQARLDNRIQLAELNLEGARNSLLKFELHMTCVLVGLDVAAMFTGLWGMNLPIPLQGNDGQFQLVSIGLVLFGTIVTCLLWLWSSKSQQRAMGRKIERG